MKQCERTRPKGAKSRRRKRGVAIAWRRILESSAEDLFTKSIDFPMLRNEIDLRIERTA
jgi:hypothetical protein